MRRALSSLAVGAACGFALGVLYVVITDTPLWVDRVAFEVLEFLKEVSK